jgi:hypothetical protein
LERRRLAGFRERRRFLLGLLLRNLGLDAFVPNASLDLGNLVEEASARGSAPRKLWSRDELELLLFACYLGTELDDPFFKVDLGEFLMYSGFVRRL